METAPATAPASGERRPRDMALSLLVLLVPIAVFIFIFRVVEKGDAPVLVDAGPVVEQATTDAAFPVLMPRGLGEQWRTVSASYRPGDGAAVLRIGYLSPSEAGLQLVESDQPADRLLPQELTAQGRPEGTVEIGGRQWQRYAARPGERALVLLEPQRTTLVIGSASEAELRELAGALSG